MDEQFQHLYTKKQEKLLKSIRNFEDLFYGTLGTC